MSPADPLIWTVRGYQGLLSPLLPPVCRFTPSCSQYAIEALRLHGPLRGAWLAAHRIARCSPLCPGGHDPVPAPAPRSPPGPTLGELPRG